MAFIDRRALHWLIDLVLVVAVSSGAPIGSPGNGLRTTVKNFSPVKPRTVFRLSWIRYHRVLRLAR